MAPKCLADWRWVDRERLFKKLNFRVLHCFNQPSRRLLQKMLENLRDESGNLSVSEVASLVGDKMEPERSWEKNVQTVLSRLRKDITRLLGDCCAGLTISYFEDGYGLNVIGPPPTKWQKEPMPLPRTVGFLVANASDWFTGQLILGAISVLKPLGFDLVVNVSNDTRIKEEERLFEMICKTDGVLVVPVSERLSAACTRALRENPCVLVDRYLHQVYDIPSVHHDDISAGRCAAEYLANRKCNKILIVSQRSEHLKKQDLTPLKDREDGCELQLRGKDVEIIPLNIAGDGESGGYEALKKFFESQTKVKKKGRVKKKVRTLYGVFATTDRTALGCRKYIESQPRTPKLNVKNVIGFEGQAFGTFLNPQLPSLYADVVGLGRLAAKVLIARMGLADWPKTTCYPHFLHRTVLLAPSRVPSKRSLRRFKYEDGQPYPNIQEEWERRLISLSDENLPTEVSAPKSD